jgi:two-component system, NarL family, invasion response regulator UvrY
MVDVLVADDHAVVRSGLKQFLASTEDLKIVAEAASAEELFALLRKVKCDVVLLDISLPDLNGLEVLKRIKHDHYALPVLIFSMFSEDEFAIPAINDGASGYLSKDSPPMQILTALRTVASGVRYVSPRLAEKLLTGTVSHGKKLPHEILSPREMGVLLLMSQGMPLTKIAGELYLSVKTVSTYRSRILEKLDLHSNADLIRYVLEHKLGYLGAEMHGHR